jgi:hypothetical protein
VPTAVHEVAAVQDSQNSWPVATLGFGLGVIDHPAPEALAGVARVPTKSTADASKMAFFIAIPSPDSLWITLDGACTSRLVFASRS